MENDFEGGQRIPKQVGSGDTGALPGDPCAMCDGEFRIATKIDPL